MNRRTLVCLLLFAACYPLLASSAVNSQSSTATTTMTLVQPPSGKCTERSLAFEGQEGMEIAGRFGTDASIDFYVLSQQDFEAIQNPTCTFPASARPLYVETNVVGYGNPYRSLPFPANGTYYFVFIFTSSPTSLASGYATVELTYPTSTTLIGTTSSLSSTVASTSTATAATIVLSASTLASSSLAASQSTIAAVGPNFNSAWSLLAVVLIATTAAIIALTRRKKSSAETVSVKRTALSPASTELPAQPEEPRLNEIPTGYGDLDRMLVGGLPKGYAILVLSIPCDERDLLVRKILGASSSSGIPTLYLSNDAARISDLVGRYTRDFYALSPQADKLTSQSAKLFKIATLESFSDINIAVAKTIETNIKQSTADKLIVIDMLTDILLEHRAAATRKWLSDFIAKRKAERFTILALLNPDVAPKAEITTIIDLFDGIVDIYERELRERSRRFLVIKKLYARKYTESELMLDKDKLF